MSLTVAQVRKQALARAQQATREVPSTEALDYRRIGIRQQQLLADAAKINPEFYGASATAPLAAGAADFGDVVDPVPTPASIDLVVIANPGTSTWPQQHPISIVAASDLSAGIPPRATLRDLVLRGVGTELDLVTSVTMYYARQAPTYNHDSGETVVELATPHDELLVIDLARILLGKSPAASSAAAVAILAALAAEEAAALDAFRLYVREYAPLESRFGVGR